MRLNHGGREEVKETVPAWDELFLRQRTNGTECSLVAWVEVQVGGANLYKRTVITCCSHGGG